MSNPRQFECVGFCWSAVPPLGPEDAGGLIIPATEAVFEAGSGGYAVFGIEGAGPVWMAFWRDEMDGSGTEVVGCGIIGSGRGDQHIASVW